MRRVMIIGSAGSGKSTLARGLADATGLPVFHMDCVFWKPGWTESTDSELHAGHEAILAINDAWIIDGNYSRTMAPRIALADTIIFLDMPRWLCMLSVVRRYWMHRGKTRPDLPPDCPETLNLTFLKWVWGYPKRARGAQHELVASFRATKEIHIFTKRKDVRDWLERQRRTNRLETHA